MSHPADPGTPVPLSALGYPGRWAALLDDCAPDGLHGRVVRADRGAITVATPDGLVRVTLRPGPPPPVTGDWVVLVDGPDPGTHVLAGIAPRSTTMSRPNVHGQRHSGDPDQVLAANVDLVGVVTPVQGEVNVRRLERGLVMAWESGATPLVLVTKVDIAEDRDMAMAAVHGAAVGVDVLPVSGVTGEGVDDLRDRLAPDLTITLLGTSGAGKSTLTNALVGEEVVATQQVRTADGKGRHTTTHRELVALPTGGAVLDTPGLRTLGLGQVEEGMAAAFPDVEALAAGCRFGDCRHEQEPGCAVTEALEDGRLDHDRFEGWSRIRAAAENAALRADTAAYRRHTRSWGKVYREAQAVKARGDGRRT